MEIDYLRQFPLFANLSPADLEHLYRDAEHVSIPAGTLLMQEGSQADALYIVLDGEFEVTKRTGDQDVILATQGTGAILGEMAVIEQAKRGASVRATRDSRILKITQEALAHVLSGSPSAAFSILNTMADRLRNTESILMQHEKMAALGTLSAGLAHELNNPAAAVRRSASQLREALAGWERSIAALGALTLDPRIEAQLDSLRAEVAQRAAGHAGLDPLSKLEQEEELQAWLEEHGVDGAWEIAPALIAFGWDAASLREWNDMPEDQARALASWLGATCLVYGLLNELGMSAERISEVVQAVKTYSYLDQAPVQEVNLHDGLENTLIILRHKIKAGVNVHREYAENLPRIEAYASELNQVWTNLIDNALDALQGSGDLTLRTYARDNQVVVEIEDNGPGIPPDVQARMFEPFYTTKEPGVGTGLGLHIAYNIIAQKHRGQIRVTSQPGQTRFQVILPLGLARSR